MLLTKCQVNLAERLIWVGCQSYIKDLICCIVSTSQSDCSCWPRH